MLRFEGRDVNRTRLLRPRVVLDTNILVSAMLSPGGKPAQVTDLFRMGQLLACLDHRMLAEYEEVLCRGGFVFGPDQPGVLLHDIRQLGLCLVTPASGGPLPDESDRPFLDVALAADAWLVTGNLKHFPGVPKVIGPAELLARWAGHDL